MFPDDLWIASQSQDFLYKYVNGIGEPIYATEANPCAVWVSQDQVTVYTANRDANTISIFRNGIRTDDIQVGNQPWGVCEDSKGAIYCTCYRDNTVYKIEDGEIVAVIQVDWGPRGICVDSDNTVWVSCFLSNTVCKIVNERFVKSVEVAQNPDGICCDPWDNIYVCCYGSNVLTKITKSYKELDVMVGQGPVACTSDSNGVICVCNYLGNNVAIVDKILESSGSTATIEVTHIDIDLGPNSCSVDSKNQFFVTSGNGSIITKIANKLAVQEIESCVNPTGYGDFTGCQLYNIWNRKNGNQGGGTPGGGDYDDEIKDLQDQIDSITNNINNIIGRLDDLEDRVSANETNIEDLIRRVTELERLISELQDQINSILDLIENLGDISGILDRLEALEQDLQDLISRVTILEQKVINIQSQITLLQEKDEDLQRQIDELKQNQGGSCDCADDIEALKQKDTDLQSQIDELKNRLDALDTTISNIQNNITQIQTDISDLQDKDDQLDLKDQDLQDQIDNIKDTIESLQPGGGLDPDLLALIKKNMVRYYDTVADMQEDTTLKPGMRCITLGYYEKGDKGGAHYNITEDTNDAELDDLPWRLEITKAEDNESTHKYYAEIDEPNEVNYKQFGAYLDGVQDDGPAMLLAHRYADSFFHLDSKDNLKYYTCKVANHDGIIYKKNQEAINCVADVDLSGSTLIVDDTNATWYGIYVWGDVNSLYWDLEIGDDVKEKMTEDQFSFNVNGEYFKQNVVIKLEEDPYTARDDSGYLYTVARRELIVHDANGLCSSPLAGDWSTAGGEEINCTITDLEHSGTKTEQSFTTFNTSYTYIPNKHGTFVGCEVHLKMSANKYCSTVWIKRHNAVVRDFVFIPDLDKLHNTSFKNSMIYVWDSYNVTVKNIQGLNAAGQATSGGSNGTSGYMIRCTNCSDVYIEDCRLQGYWGATAMDSVKNIHMSRCHLNRFDIHDYFYNLWLTDCTFYNHSIQIGYGRGCCNVNNCNFYYNPLTIDSYESAHMIEFNLTYGRIFEGELNIENCNAKITDPPDNEFNVFKMEFSPDATSITKHFKFPKIRIRNVDVWCNKPDAHFAYFKVTGSRRCTTSSIAPSHMYGVCEDGTAQWTYLGRGVDWNGDINAIGVNSILRCMDSFLDLDKKTQFYNRRYYICTQAGTLDFSGQAPSSTNPGEEITCGTAKLKYFPDALWQSKHQYEVNDICATSPSNFYPLYIFKCSRAGISNGYYPTHTSGTVLEGINDAVNEPDDCWWTYVDKTTNWCIQWTPSMSVTTGQIINAYEYIYEVMSDGTLLETPPYDTMWFGEHTCGTARLKFIGQKWSVQAWFKMGSYCIAGENVYQLSKHDGITSGVLPVRGNPYCVDGDIIWKYISGTGDGGGGTVGPEPPDEDLGTVYLNEQITASGTDAWLDTYKYNIPSGMTKLRITMTSGAGSVDVKYVTVGDPWAEGDTGITFGGLSATPISKIFTVTPGSTIRPIFNYYSGQGSLLIKLEGGSNLESETPEGTIPPYSETATLSLSNNEVSTLAEEDTWKANTAYNIGDTVISHSNTYECVFDGKLVMPIYPLTIRDVTTNFNNGRVFWFYTGTNIPIKLEGSECKVMIQEPSGLNGDCELKKGSDYWFGNSSNPTITFYEINNPQIQDQ